MIIRLTRIGQNRTDQIHHSSSSSLFFFRADCGSIRAQVKSLGRKSTEKKEERGQKRFLGQMAEMVKEKNQVSEKGREKKYCERMFQTWLAASREFRLHPYIFSSLYGLASSQFETT